MAATVRYRPDRKTWTVYVSRKGKRKAYAFATEAEANAFARQLSAEHEAGDTWLDGVSTLTEPAVRGWLDRCRPLLSKSYEKTAEGLIENHLVPHFGALRLRDITETHLIAYAEAVYLKQKKRKSGATALNALSLLRRVCQIHVDAGILDRNPCARVGALVKRVGRRHEPEIVRAAAWTREEAAGLLGLAAAHEKHLYGPLLCGFSTGMRRGEILGLEWRDIGPATIAVERGWVRGESKSPKSGKARDIPLSAPLRAFFDELRAMLKTREAFRDPGPVFQPEGGGHWDEANFGRAWRRLMKLAIAAGIRPLRFHDTRHTFASWALDSGKSIKQVQEWLGHSSPELTLRTYAHLMKSEGDEMGFLDLATKMQPGATGVSSALSTAKRRKFLVRRGK